MTITSYDQISSAVITTLASLVLAILSFLFRQLWSYLNNRSKSIQDAKQRDAVQAAIAEADHITTIVMASAQADYDNLKAQNGGNISASDFLRLKNESIEKVKSILSKEAQTVLTNHLGDIESYLLHLVQSKVSA